MRYAILADIHSNLAAFEAVLNDIEEKGGVDELWCLGDIVGYGPDPSACIELLCQKEHICVVGNHDYAAIGNLDLTDFNPDAAAACRWAAQQLTPDEVNYLKGLPKMIQRGDFTLVHGSPREPIWEYILSTGSAKDNLDWFETRYCLVGHSHVPLVFEYIGETDTCVLSELPLGTPIRLEEQRLIINPGGVGQPRDGDPRASYAIYDSDENAIRHYRVPYDITTTQEKMEHRGLPTSLIVRLRWGW